MKKFLLIVGMLPLLSFAGDLPAGKPYSEAERKKFMAKFSKTAGKVDRLQLDFGQKRHTALFRKPLVATGRCWFAKPDKLRWEVFTPYRSILLYNGSEVAKFDYRENKLRKLKMGSPDILRRIIGQISRWMQGDFSESESVYNLSVYSGKDCRFLTLVPKSEKMRKYVKSVVLRSSNKGYRITEVRINESASDYIVISFTREKINPPFPDRLFDPENPCQGRK